MDNNFSNIKERILQLAKNKGFPLENFFDEIGMSYGNFKGENKKRPINSDALANILTLIPDANPTWLLTGNGSMFKSEQNSVGNISAGGDVIGSGIVNGSVTVHKKSDNENNTEDISNLLNSYNVNKGVEIDRLQALYTTILDGKDAIIREKDILIQELKDTIKELKEDKKFLKQALESKNN